MFNVPHQVYTAKFKEAALQRAKDGQGLSAVARELGMSTQTLRNWLKASVAGKLSGSATKLVTPEQMELSRPRAENKRLLMVLEVAKKPRRVQPMVATPSGLMLERIATLSPGRAAPEERSMRLSPHCSEHSMKRRKHRIVDQVRVKPLPSEPVEKGTNRNNSDL